MASTRRLLGKLSPQQAVRFIMGRPGQIQTGRTPRVGRRIRLERERPRVEGAPERQKISRAMRKFKNWVKLRAATTHNPKRKQELKHYLEFHQPIENLGVQPTAYQLAAILALAHGITEKQLAPHLGVLATTEAHQPKKTYWKGYTTNLMKALRSDLPARIEQTLYENEQILDSKQIAKKLGLEWNHQNQSNINYALQLLQQAKLAREEPLHSTTAATSTWAHAAHPDLPIRHPNSELEILEAIHVQIQQTGQNKIELKKLCKPDPHNKGNPQAKYSHRAINSSSVLLEQQGLLTRTRLKTGKAGQQPIELSLTPKDLKLITNHIQNERKSTPQLRNALLGTPNR